jgi:guanylate kinase
VKNGSLVVVSGPSGSGKSSLCKAVCEVYGFAQISISTTTRAPREGEQNGVDYHFASKEQFRAAIDSGDFLEWAQVHDNFYGTSKSRVEEALLAGQTVLFDIDVQGQAAISALFPRETTSVFVTTPDIAVLRERLQKRGTDSEEVIEKRLINALGEMNQLERYDYLLINDDYAESLEVLKSIVLASRYKESRVSLPAFISTWKGQS